MVNTSVYIFGVLNNGYTQYPDNYSRDVYQNFYVHASAKSQIVIHRDSGLMYYGYIRKLDNVSQYIGFCILLNDMMFSNISLLFPIFENAVAEMVTKGEILTFNENGDIVSKNNELIQSQQEIIRISNMITNAIGSLDRHIERLPPVDYSKSNKEKKQFNIADPNDAIVEASYKYAYTYVAKDKGCDTSSLAGYKGVVKKISKEKSEISSQYYKLKSQYDKLNKQKNQYKKVVVLCFIVVVCGVGLFILKNALNDTELNLQQAREENVQKSKTINDQKTSIASLKNNIVDLKSLLSAEKEHRMNIEQELEQLTKIYNEKQPLFVKSTSFDFGTGWLSFDYYGFCDKEVTLSVKAFNGEYSYSNSATLSVEKGHHSSSIYLSSGLNSSKWYSFELLIGNKIVGGDRH